MNTIIFWYLLMILVQIFHIFEEINMEAYKLMGSLKKYLLAASVIISLNFIFLSLIILNLQMGYILGILGAIMAILNGFIHVAGYIKTRSFKGTIGTGVFTGIPLGIIGFVILYYLISLFI